MRFVRPPLFVRFGCPTPLPPRLLEQKDTGTAGHWDIGMLGHQDTGTLAQWEIGTMGHWCYTTLEQWDIRTFGHQDNWWGYGAHLPHLCCHFWAER